MKQPMKPAYRNLYRIYVFACAGAGIWMQSGKLVPNYFIGFFTGVVGSWIGPGMVVGALAHGFKLGEVGVPLMFGISAAFWLAFFTLARSGRPRTAPRQPRGGGLVVDTSGYDVLPNLPPGLGYYSKPTTHTKRTAYYMDEGE